MYISYLYLQIDIFVFVDGYPDNFFLIGEDADFFQVSSLKPAEAVGAWKAMGEKS